MALHLEPPPFTSQLQCRQIWKHKHKVGDRIGYFFVTNKGKYKSYCLSLVEIVACLYDDQRLPRYEIKVFDRIRVNKGTASRRGIKKTTHPHAYALDENWFPPKQWEEQIRRKCNLTKPR